MAAELFARRAAEAMAAPDGSERVDAGVATADGGGGNTGVEDGGCGCRTTGRASTRWLAGLGLAAALVRRRRRRGGLNAT